MSSANADSYYFRVRIVERTYYLQSVDLKLTLLV